MLPLGEYLPPASTIPEDEHTSGQAPQWPGGSESQTYVQEGTAKRGTGGVGAPPRQVQTPTGSARLSWLY